MTQPFGETSSEKRQPEAPIPAGDWPQTIASKVNSVKYGSVQVVVQDGQVIQINSTDKVRFDQPQSRNHHGHKPASFRGR
jgi:hypothetical protein